MTLVHLQIRRAGLCFAPEILLSFLSSCQSLKGLETGSGRAGRDLRQSVCICNERIPGLHSRWKSPQNNNVLVTEIKTTHQQQLWIYQKTRELVNGEFNSSQFTAVSYGDQKSNMTRNLFTSLKSYNVISYTQLMISVLLGKNSS